ncbi:bacterial alpha-L-rhamnosidase domain-containing protein [Massarina eburnea CBS 473.64]|uniref:Bacterial alpha-L-rhamnosidase domain-containing protein n=1 Tax=Massarina eburnea CBS 473.64 TaxID=1395130 RepID=A0A6A6RNW7_9PLEO|nr:bacterial alpha-L-rhamnosidase domain-containing protein [Massarina eburnea CBS 473.64]
MRRQWKSCFWLSIHFASYADSVAAANPWDAYIHSPVSRYINPISAHSTVGTVTTTGPSEGQETYTLSPNSRLTFDFGVEVGGWISFSASTTNATNTSTPHLSLAFTESPSFIGPLSDDTGATTTQNHDQALNVTLPQGTTVYELPREKFRGGFRFLTLNAAQNVTVFNVTCEIGFAPKTRYLRNYPGYFWTPGDELLVRTWYAGAYTVQTNIAPQNTGRFLPQVSAGWIYNSSLGIAAPILLDGAKRDRAVWPGDLGIQGTTAFLALGADGLEAFENALETVFYYQNSSTGRFPFAGPSTGSFRSGAQSDTYHAWSLISIFNFALFVGDEAWVGTHWANITRGVEFILNGIDESGLHEQIATNDWARQGGGGYNSALNALDYHALSSIADLGRTYTNDVTVHAQAAEWAAAAETLKAEYNKILWDPQQNMYRDNQSTSLHPQDGNALALLYNLTLSPVQSSLLSVSLTRFWTPLGPVTPELPDTISPFISSIEVLAHFTALQPKRALNLTRTLWSYLLDSPLMTGSTLAEGITANGSLYYRGDAGYKKDARYTSLSHGWSTGPTAALTFKIAGLEIVGWRRWIFAPSGESLRDVKAGYQSPMGMFSVEWKSRDDVDGAFDFFAKFTTPEGTNGSIELPWKCKEVLLDGVILKSGIDIEGRRAMILQASSCT